MPQTTKMITSRFDQPDSFTLSGYERTGGYRALRNSEPQSLAGELQLVHHADRQSGYARYLQQRALA